MDIWAGIKVWAPNRGLDSGFEVMVLGWSSGPWHEGLDPVIVLIPWWMFGLEGGLGPGMEVWGPNGGLCPGRRSGAQMKVRAL